MKRTVNERIKMLRTHLNLTQQEFAETVGITSTQLSRIENGDGVPQKSTLAKICSATNVTFDWLTNGNGEFKPQVISQSNELSFVLPWKDEAYKQVINERDSLKKELDRCWQMIGHITSGVKPNFLKAFNGTGLKKRSLGAAA